MSKLSAASKKKSSHMLFLVSTVSVGSILEMYDFVIYAMLANVLSTLFFPNSDPYTATLQVYGIFAIGYLSRPLGGIIFGHISDRYGRQQGLIISIILMAIPMLLIACLPTYQSIGKLAPILLLILRFISGISISGEFSSGTTFLAEHANPNHRGFTASFLYFGINVGILLASLISTLLSWSLSQHALQLWGWRIAFLFGSVLAIIGFVIRKKMTESPIFEKFKKEKRLFEQPVLKVLHLESRQITRSFSIICLMAAVISLIFLYMPVYLKMYLHLSLFHALLWNTISLIVFSSLIPLFAWISDITSRNFILAIGAYCFLFLSIPLYDGLSSIYPSTQLSCLICLSIISATIVGPIAATLSERFQAPMRASGIGIAYNLSFGLVGGLAPISVTYLIHHTRSLLSPAFYLMTTALISLIAIINMRDYTRKPIDEVDRKLEKLRHI